MPLPTVVSWPLVWTLVQRFRRLTSYKYYFALIGFPIFFLATSHFFPLPDDFFTRFAYNERGHRNHCLVVHSITYLTLNGGSLLNGNDKAFSPKQFVHAYSKFYGVNNLILRDGKNQSSGNEFGGYLRNHSVNVDLDAKANEFSLAIVHQVYANKLQLNALDTRYFSQNDSFVHLERADFVSHLWQMVAKKYGLKAKFKIGKVHSMDAEVKQFLVKHLSMSLRLAPAMRALACAAVKALYNLEADLSNGFIAMLLGSQSRATLRDYFYAQFIWSLTYGLHLLWIGVIVVLWIVDVDFAITLTMLLSLSIGLLLLSYDLQVTAHLYLLLLRNREVALATFALFNLMCYLVLLTTVEPGIFTSSLLWFGYDQSPLLIIIFRTLSSFFPGKIQSAICPKINTPICFS